MSRRDRRSRALLPVLLTGALLLACSTPPDLAPVREASRQPLQRLDRFQAAISNGQTFIVGGTNGALLISVDAGHTWKRRTLSGSSSLIGLTRCADGSFVALDFYHKIWVSRADVYDWREYPVPGSITPLAIHCDQLGRYWVVGTYTTILSSNNQGLNWTLASLDRDAMLTTIQFLDAQHGVVTGEFGTVATTADGGIHWKKLPGITRDFYPFSTYFIDLQHGWTCGIAGALLYTSDGGMTWVPHENPAGTSVYSLVPAGNNLYGIASNGRIILLNKDTWKLSNAAAVGIADADAAALSNDGQVIVVGGNKLQSVQLPTIDAFTASRLNRGLADE